MKINIFKGKSEETFRERYSHAITEFAKQFGYSCITGHPEKDWNPRDITPMRLGQAGYQMFLAGAKAAFVLRRKDKKGIETELKSLQPEFDFKK